MIYAREERHILWSALQNHIIHHGSLVRNRVCLQYGNFCHLYPIVKWDDVCSNLDCELGNHYCGFPRQCSIERQGDFGAPSDKTGYRSGKMSSFQKNPGSASNTLMTICVFKTLNAHPLLAFYIDIEVLHWCNGLDNPWVHATYISSLDRL